jgi:hypothetical protein
MTVRSTVLGADERSALTVVVIAVAVLLSACGGGGGTHAASDGVTTSVSAAGGTAAKATGGDGAFCDAVRAQFAQLSSVGDASSLDAGVRLQYFTTQKELNANVRGAAPAALRKDIDTQTGASDALADARIRGDAAAATAASTQVRAPETQAAGTRVSAYVKDHCGFEATPGG